MSYVPAGVTEEEFRSAVLELRRESNELHRDQIEADRKAALFSGVAAFAAAFVPLATFFGWAALVRGKKS